VQNTAYWISTASLSGLPATVAPIGLTDEGLPVGIQILAPMWEDATSIEFAALLSDVTGGFVAPPSYAE
jgi:amidase